MIWIICLLRKRTIREIDTDAPAQFFFYMCSTSVYAYFFARRLTPSLYKK